MRGKVENIYLKYLDTDKIRGKVVKSELTGSQKSFGHTWPSSEPNLSKSVFKQCKLGRFD